MNFVAGPSISPKIVLHLKAVLEPQRSTPDRGWWPLRGAADKASSAPSDTTTTLITSWQFNPRSPLRAPRGNTHKEYHGKKGHWIRQAADPCRQGEPGAPRRHRSRSAGNQHHGVLQSVQRSDAGPG